MNTREKDWKLPRHERTEREQRAKQLNKRLALKTQEFNYHTNMAASCRHQMFELQKELDKLK